MAAFEDPLPVPVPYSGAFVEGVDFLSWMANNSEKLISSQNKAPQCWTFFSTAAYAKKNKVPQVGFSRYINTLRYSIQCRN